MHRLHASPCRQSHWHQLGRSGCTDTVAVPNAFCVDAWLWLQTVRVWGHAPTQMSYWEQQLYPCSRGVPNYINVNACMGMHENPCIPMWGKHRYAPCEWGLHIRRIFFIRTGVLSDPINLLCTDVNVKYRCVKLYVNWCCYRIEVPEINKSILLPKGVISDPTNPTISLEGKTQLLQCHTTWTFKNVQQELYFNKYLRKNARKAI